MLKPDYSIDLNWLYQISYSLDNFKQASVSGKTFVCRCPYCGDSQKSKKKARFHFYTKNYSLNFDCKNCGEHGSFWRFMEEQFPNLFDDYKKEQLLKRFESHSQKSQRKTYQSSSKQQKPLTQDDKPILKGVVCLSELDDDHEAVKYLLSRSFTRNEINRLYYSSDFKLTAQSINPEPLSENFPSEPRIVIPFYDTDGKIELIQGRSLDNHSKLRYITIKSHDNVDKIFGREKVDFTKTVYCVEGPLDSLFVDNCIATCDSALEKSNADVLIWDNQQRNKEIIELMESAIKKGKSIVVWPVSSDTKIDINDMIKMGITKNQLMHIIRKRTFKGLKAKLELNQWKRI